METEAPGETPPTGEVDILGLRVSVPRLCRLLPASLCVTGSLAGVMTGSRSDAKLAPGEEWHGLGEGRLALRKLCVQAGSCPASPGALGWSCTDLLGASFEKGIEIEEALLER